MKKLFASAVAAALAMSMAVPAFAATTGSVSVNADKNYVNAGDKFAVEFKVENVSEMLNMEGVAGTGNLGAGDLTIVYNPDQVTPEIGRKLDGFSDKFDVQLLTDVKDSEGAAVGRITMSFADTYAIGTNEDFSLGSLTFTVNDSVADGDTIEIGTAATRDIVFATTSKDPTSPNEEDRVSAKIMADDVAMGKATVTVGEEPATTDTTPDEPTTDEPTTDEPTTDEPTTDEPTTDEPTTGGSTGDTTDGDKTSGGSTGGSGTTGGSGDNNKTGDAGVLAIGGLMVLAAGATMLTLKKKSK